MLLRVYPVFPADISSGISLESSHRKGLIVLSDVRSVKSMSTGALLLTQRSISDNLGASCSWRSRELSLRVDDGWSSAGSSDAAKRKRKKVVYRWTPINIIRRLNFKILYYEMRARTCIVCLFVRHLYSACVCKCIIVINYCWYNYCYYFFPSSVPWLPYRLTLQLSIPYCHPYSPLSPSQLVQAFFI